MATLEGITPYKLPKPDPETVSDLPPIGFVVDATRKLIREQTELNETLDVVVEAVRSFSTLEKKLTTILDEKDYAAVLVTPSIKIPQSEDFKYQFRSLFDKESNFEWVQIIVEDEVLEDPLLCTLEMDETNLKLKDHHDDKITIDSFGFSQYNNFFRRMSQQLAGEYVPHPIDSETPFEERLQIWQNEPQKKDRE